MERNIKVTGRAKVSVAPDTIQLSIELSGTRQKYEDAAALSASHTQALTECLAPLGFERADLKTCSFGIDPRYEGYNDPHGNYRQRFVGYAYHHDLTLRFPVGDMLGRVISALAGCSAEPQFSVGYTVADPEPIRNDLLARSVADSRRKAGILASAAGVSLGDIALIDYSWGEVSIYAAPMGRMEADMCKCSSDCAIDITPDDIDLEDTVTVVWEIYTNL